MKRYGSSNNLADNFSYQYFSGTNRLKKVSAGLADDYAYDNNGNMISDQLNRTGSIKYDHRNLMTEIRAIKTEAGGGIGGGTVDVTYLTQYRYDEAGNRVRKTRWKYTGSNPDPVFDISGDSPPWSQQSDEFYVRDISGKEIAIYSGSFLTQWNIWGLDNVGKINADTTRNYYLKDHLGSIRVVLNSTNGIISAQDYDAWGYPLENRSYQSTNTLYKFTGKERDNETGYDYFGARYYDSRIGRWGGVDMLQDTYIDLSPYIYTANNPILYIDPDGLNIKLNGSDEQKSYLLYLIKLGLPSSVHDYIKLNSENEIDKDLLNQANGITDDENFAELLEIVNDGFLTELNLVDIIDDINYYDWKTNKQETITLEKIDPFGLGMGLTLLAWRDPLSQSNPGQSPVQSGKNEVFIYEFNPNIGRQVKILAHEIYGHVNRYNRGESFEDASPSFDKAVKEIENRAIKNFNENNK